MRRHTRGGISEQDMSIRVRAMSDFLWRLDDKLSVRSSAPADAGFSWLYKDFT